jgi:hypothetical protein
MCVRSPPSGVGGLSCFSSFGGVGCFSAWAQPTVTLVDQNFDTGAVTFTVDVGAAISTWVLVEYTTDPSPTQCHQLKKKSASSLRAERSNPEI